MKKNFLPIVSLVLVLALLVSTTGSALAAPGDDPVVTPVSGDAEFTTEVVPVPALPGSVVLASQMFAPVGFTEGETQFDGAGVRVMGLDAGKASACFSLSTVALNQGWGGKVGVWNGSKWVLLPTTFSTSEESTTTLACASVAGDGTYAFIKYVADPDKLPSYCASLTAEWSLSNDSDEGGPYFYVHLHNLAFGTPAVLTFVSADPSENYSGFNSVANATVGNEVSGDADFVSSNFAVDGPVTVTLQVTAAGCSKIMQISFEAPAEG